MPDSFNTKIKVIPLKSILPNPGQPRKYFDPDSMDALTRSIERYGVLSPITVRECSTDEYELISGERRYRAAYAAGLADIPCIVLDASRTDCAILSLLENLQREDLSFLEIAESYRELVKKEGYTSRELSRKLGDKAYEIKERMNLMRLDPIVRKYIRSFRLTERQASALLRIRDKEHQIEAARQICENSLNESETIKYINSLINSGNSPTVHINKIKDIKMLRNTIADAVGIVRESGINAEYSESSTDDEQKFTIVIHN
ncbi:MAG: ParB/RepB/Spo0J family partition protein [Oscillospiraceae bacterium]|nr:ParB/RepB/Spo0J family partition protein [Oscillospiraceae bacterium]